MISSLIDKLGRQSGNALHSGARHDEIDRAESRMQLVLPEEHKELLLHSNGLELFKGYRRLFGLSSAETIDSISWNDYEHWKFAWRDVYADYWCFGESAFGTQYAYLTNDLDGKSVAKVYRHDGFVPEVIAGSFGEFLEMLTGKYRPDWFDLQVQDHFGLLDPQTNLIYLPPVGLLPTGGEYDLKYIATMDARWAMICNGDAYVQLTDAGEGVIPSGFAVYRDAEQRVRLQIDWQ